MKMLGKKGRDRITGFEGIIVGRAEYLYGCAQFCLSPPVVENKLVDSQWFDDGRIEIIGNGVKPESVQVELPGGPNRDLPIHRRRV